MGSDTTGKGNGNGIEGLLERLYARNGLAYLLGGIAVVVVYALLVFGLGVGTMALLLGASMDEFWELLLVAWACLSLVVAVAFTSLAVRHRDTLRWLYRGGAPRDVEETLDTTLTIGYQSCRRAILLGLPLEFAYSFYLTDVVGVDTAMAAVVFFGAQVFVITGAVGLVVFGFQLGIRPVVRHLVGYLPEGATLGQSRFGLAQQLAARLTVIGLLMFLCGLLIAGVTDDQELRFVVGIVSGPLFILLIGAVVFPLVWPSLLGPVKELIDANRRVAAGDLSAKVTVTTRDELGELGASFNEMTADLRASRARIVVASDESRRRVERDLHDGAQQHLVLLRLKLNQLAPKVEGDPEATALVDELSGDLNSALRELRDLAHGLYPAVLESDGLLGALHEAAERSAIPTSVECDGAGRYPSEFEAAVYFCCLEALQNAGKHAGEAARVTVSVSERDGALAFEVADDGDGYDASAEPSGHGLQNMRDRLGALGGTLNVDATPGKGTKIRGVLPLPSGRG